MPIITQPDIDLLQTIADLADDFRVDGAWPVQPDDLLSARPNDIVLELREQLRVLDDLHFIKCTLVMLPDAEALDDLRLITMTALGRAVLVEQRWAQHRSELYPKIVSALQQLGQYESLTSNDIAARFEAPSFLVGDILYELELDGAVKILQSQGVNGTTIWKLPLLDRM